MEMTMYLKKDKKRGISDKGKKSSNYLTRIKD